MDETKSHDAFARAAIGQARIFDGLRRVLPLLATEGVTPMPLKGALLAWSLYPSPLERPLSDADLLVRPEHFDRATAVLARAGGRVVPRWGPRKHVIEFHAGKTWWSLDLHCALWKKGFVDLDLEDAWNGARTWQSPFGVDLLVPPRRFTFGHVTAHFARNGYVAGDAATQDVVRLVPWTLAEETPETMATYLMRAGAAACAFYALSAALQPEPPPGYLDLLQRIRPPRPRAAALRAFASGPRIHHRVVRPFLVTPVNGRPRPRNRNQGA